MRNLTATICLTLAVLLGSAGMSWGADLQKGYAAYNSGDFATALREWTPLAKQGYARAQYNLGLMYDNGQGVPQDDKTAVKWYRLAAEQGNAPAQSNLGAMYDKGQGVPQNDKTAVKWYRLAAEQGDASAQSNLGFVYSNGKGVPQDYKTALKWYRLAAEQGSAVAQEQYGELVLQDFVYGSDVRELKNLAESMETLCQNNRAHADGIDFKCVFDKIWAYLDITGDRRLSLAEISRFQRNIIKFAAVEEANEKVEIGEIVAINLAAIIFLPITASSILHSFDYNSDGFLSKSEVFGDTEFSKLVGINVDTLATGLDFQSLGIKLKDAMNQIPFLNR